ncbi:hypothetical protein DFH09DRAFT_1071354 [Mycena vulgaris]|nr:hypothetical protein DFH09DRAFT_1071354 [Mycena vulgaris]
MEDVIKDVCVGEAAQAPGQMGMGSRLAEGGQSTRIRGESSKDSEENERVEEFDQTSEEVLEKSDQSPADAYRERSACVDNGAAVLYSPPSQNDPESRAVESVSVKLRSSCSIFDIQHILLTRTWQTGVAQLQHWQPISGPPILRGVDDCGIQSSGKCCQRTPPLVSI